MTSQDNEQTDRRLYKWPDSDVLRNKLNIRDRDELDQAERQLVALRQRDPGPEGDFDLGHLQAIHKHLFQDVYAWAGEIRQVDIHKTDWFMPKGRIQTAMNDVHGRIQDQNYLKDLAPEAFAEQAGVIIGDVNYIHPFREGNGRTQMEYLRQLSEQAGHDFDQRRIDGDAWIKASIAANDAKYDLMAKQIAQGLDPGHTVDIESVKTKIDQRSQAQDREEDPEQDL